MRLEMLKWLQATDDVVPFDHDARFTPEMLWARVRGMVPPEKTDEVKQMIADGINFPMLMHYCRELAGQKSLKRRKKGKESKKKAEKMQKASFSLSLL